MTSASRLAAFLLMVMLSGCASASAPLLDMFMFPGADDQGKPQTQVRALPGCELVHLTTAGGETVVAMFGPAQDSDGDTYANAKLRPTFLYFYGNGACIATSLREFNQFRRVGRAGNAGTHRRVGS